MKTISCSFISEEKVHLADFRVLEWLFPETTANFNKLLIQYRGFCGYTFAVTDGLLLPGMLLKSLRSLPVLYECLLIRTVSASNIVWTRMVNQGGDAEMTWRRPHLKVLQGQYDSLNKRQESLNNEGREV